MFNRAGIISGGPVFDSKGQRLGLELRSAVHC